MSANETSKANSTLCCSPVHGELQRGRRPLAARRQRKADQPERHVLRRPQQVFGDDQQACSGACGGSDSDARLERPCKVAPSGSMPLPPRPQRGGVSMPSACKLDGDRKGEDAVAEQQCRATGSSCSVTDGNLPGARSVSLSQHAREEDQTRHTKL